jgi:ElaB/YqjD/DUF883 family membrane-anchored ribosome-binding protein
MENETDVIRQQMLETRTALSEKLEALQEQVLTTVEDTTKTVTDTVQTVQDAVTDTVSTVSETVQDTVDTVKETFDVTEQVQKHPWLMVGGAVALGYLGGRLLNGASTQGFPQAVTSNGHVPSGSAPPSRPAWLESLAGPVLEQVRELAVGALAGVAADLIRQHVPPDFRPHLEEMTSNIASALGAKPLHGLVSDGSPQKTNVS